MNPDDDPLRHTTYRDEEFGGTIVALGRRLGGPNTAQSVAVQTLNKFCSHRKLQVIGA